MASKIQSVRIGTEFNIAVGAGADIFDDNIPIPEDGIVRVTVSENTGVVFQIAITRAGITRVVAYNSGAALAADAGYTFDCDVLSGDEINFRFAAGTTIHVMDVKLIRVL